MTSFAMRLRPRSLDRGRGAGRMGLQFEDTLPEAPGAPASAFATDTGGTIYFNNTGAAIPAGMAGASVLS
jgi:hypothetical protein